MPYEDAARVSSFYEKAFGWGMQGLGEEMGNYVMAQTAETDANGMVQAPGTINGGFYAKSSGAPTEPSVVIAVTDLDDSMNRVREAGGVIMGEPMDIPGIGRYAAFTDTEGNRVGMLQPAPMA